MPTKDPRIDKYIKEAADFAKPILIHIRNLVHAGCPDVEETLKWGMPSFLHEGILCGMAAFKQHCTFGFWKGSLIIGKDGRSQEEAMGQFGRLTSLTDLPSDKVILGYIKEAIRLNDEDVQVPRRAPSKVKKKELVIPDYFLAVLKKNKKVFATFEQFSYSHKKEYVEWITEAKAEETRQRRLQTALKWLAEGKARHWKYEKC